MSTNRILLLGAVALVLYFAGTYALRAVFPYTEVGYETALEGRVTGVVLSKRRSSFFLNGQLSNRYDFDAFTPASSPDRPDARQEQSEDNDLGHYLRKGDRVLKSGNATLLLVQRGDSLSRWACAPPQATP